MALVLSSSPIILIISQFDSVKILSNSSRLIILSKTKDKQSLLAP
jgi:hypothetical protein